MMSVNDHEGAGARAPGAGIGGAGIGGAGTKIDDAVVVQALDEYRAARAAGHTPSRDALLARHPHVAQELADCLDALDFLEGAVSQLPGEAPPGWSEPVLGR